MEGQPISRPTPTKNDNALIGGGGDMGLRKKRTATVKKPPKNEDELKAEAVKTNPRGVFIYNQNLEDSKAVMAGYLGLEDTDQLYDLLADKGNKQLLEEFKRCRDAGFGVAGKHATSTYQAKTLFKSIESMGPIERNLLDTKELPIRANQLEGVSINNPAPAYLTFIVVMHRLIVTNPTTFKGGDGSLLEGHTPEDWHRAYSLIRFYNRQVVLAKGGQFKCGNRTAAKMPSFLKESDFRATAQEDGESGEAQEDGEDMDDGSAVEVLDESSDEESDNDHPSRELKEDVEGNIEDALEKNVTALSRGGDLNAATKKSGRVLLKRGQVARFLVGQANKVHVLHDQGSNLQRSMQRAVQQIEAKAGYDVLSFKEQQEMDSQLDLARQNIFWKTMSKLSTVSVELPTYLESCAALQVDPEERELGSGGDKFMPWQIIAVYKMLMMENSIYGGGINASDCGLGKTVTALALIECAARVSKEMPQPTTPEMTPCNNGELSQSGNGETFKPTLVVCPSQLIDVWHDDWKKYFEGRLVYKQFYGSVQNVNTPMRRAAIIGGHLQDLLDYLDQLDSSDAKTGLTVIVTSYSTWWKRTLWGRHSNQPVKAKHNSGAGDDDEADDDHDGNDEDDETTSAIEAEFFSKVEGRFARVICDEAHAIKNRRTHTHRAVKHLCAPKKWFLSATPMINHVKDLSGYLHLLWQDSWELPGNYDIVAFYKPDFDPMPHLAQDASGLSRLITAVNEGRKPYLLNPADFSRVARADTPEPALIGSALRAILSEIQLRHTMASEIELDPTDVSKTIRIGQDIPIFRTHTVELKMSREQARVYSRMWRRHAGQLYLGKSSEGEGEGEGGEVDGGDTSTGRLNMLTHRRVVHATLNYHLETIVDKIGKRSLVKDINAWYSAVTKEFGEDYGASHFFRNARAASYYQPYGDRLRLAEFIVAPSVKMQYLCGLLHSICFEKKERVQVVVDMPMEQWTVEMFLVTLGLNVLSLRSAHSQVERRETIKKFNDQSASVDVLVTNFRTSSLGVNLQGCCCKTVILDTASNINTIIQTIGRIHRLGQKSVQDIWIVTVDETYDQVLQARATNKMISQLIGEAQVSGEDEEAMITAAENLIVKMLGQRCSRREWGELDLKAKNKLKQTTFMAGGQKPLGRGTPQKGKQPAVSRPDQCEAQALQPHQEMNGASTSQSDPSDAQKEKLQRLSRVNEELDAVPAEQGPKSRIVVLKLPLSNPASDADQTPEPANGEEAETEQFTKAAPTKKGNAKQSLKKRPQGEDDDDYSDTPKNKRARRGQKGL